MTSRTVENLSSTCTRNSRSSSRRREERPRRSIDDTVKFHTSKVVDNETQSMLILTSVCRITEQRDLLEARIASKGQGGFGEEEQLISALLNKAQRCAQLMLSVLDLEDSKDPRDWGSARNHIIKGEELLDKATSLVEVQLNLGRESDGHGHGEHGTSVLLPETNFRDSLELAQQTSALEDELNDVVLELRKWDVRREMGPPGQKRAEEPTRQQPAPSTQSNPGPGPSHSHAPPDYETLGFATAQSRQTADVEE